MEKPTKDINDVISSFINFIDAPSDINTYPSAEATQEGNDFIVENNVLIIPEGKIKIYGKQNNLLFGDISGPFILGITPDVVKRVYISRDKSHFSYLSYPKEFFFNHIDNENLWRQLFRILSYSNFLIAERLAIMNARNLYDVVKHYLIEINKKKCDENICLYIIARTGYSKSGVMTILKELKKGGYIKVNNGRLTGIKELPLRF